MSVPYTSFLAVFFVLWLTGLASLVAWWRMRTDVRFGDGGDERLEAAIRAHANALESMLPFLLVFFLYELQHPPAWALWGLGGGFCLARVSHAIGMLFAFLPCRRWGAISTFTLTVALCGALGWSLLA